MMTTLLKSLKLPLFAVAIMTVSGAPPTIGVASALGTFTLNSFEVVGNANLFDGSQIKTEKASSKVYLMSGAALVLGVNSTGTIYRDHFDLSTGAAKVDNLSGYAIHAGRFDIRAAKPASQTMVKLNHGAVEVAALAGSVNVFDERGALLTRLAAGTASSFQTGLNTMPSGASIKHDNNNQKRRIFYMTLATAGALAGLGLATDAILQPSSTSP